MPQLTPLRTRVIDRNSGGCPLLKVVVVGAGIAGASAAFHLPEFGVEVYLVDNSPIGKACGVRGRSTYRLAPPVDAPGAPVNGER
jgi:glycine/D-amino acid oxidase-like deaminating enzyme